MNKEQVRAEAIEALRNVGRAKMALDAALSNVKFAILRAEEAIKVLDDLEDCAKSILTEIED